MDYLIGVDLGTTSTKVVLFDTKGHVIASANKGYKLYRDAPDMAEEDLDEIWEAFTDAMAQVTRAAKDGKILGVSFSSAMHSLIAFDADWQPLTRVITWADARAVKYTEELKSNGIGQEIYSKTGTPIHPMAPLSKLLWLKNEHTDIYNNAVHYLGIKEFLFNRLFGANKMDYSIASGTGLFNIFNLDWDEQALSVTGITKEQLPEPVDPYTIETGMDPQYAAEMGLDVDTPFIYGAGDGPLSNLGVNAIQPGVAAVTIGTSGAIRVVTDAPKIDPKGRTFTYALDKDHWVVGGPVNNGGDVFRWARDNMFDSEKSTAELLGIDSYDLLTEIASKIPAGADGLLFHPYLGGERAPIWDANARGSFFGLTHNHTRAHMVRAVLEGIIFNIYMVSLALEEVVGDLSAIQATGGFARSPLWRQMAADIFEQPVTVPTAFESGALAATVMAQKALGLIDNLEVIGDMIGEANTYQPNPENYDAYRELTPIFIRLSRQLQTEYKAIADYQRTHIEK
ncbi:gluconokinase [Weissella paramesenteroides]|uniref:Gluconokinase n=1 Tax=Weissella paramesenteroides ATCC 33313 TaxID=585506 RepID=C5RCI4_WEIPA|nr:gluconokinase [Weissella paramesenteroides]ATF41440.1 gluconokinase [Weissella paramesenteroides]EER74140.1 gluconokinase [Weissella paramesenteroides ATCC 33313]MBU7557288.1 gluconokinase [Weissella paramesenteroides]MDF8367373.1 gluconokinase [Weissella paramesenteroides]NEZ88665.1 gluconokinase [Weissella paramesenteroides]